MDSAPTPEKAELARLMQEQGLVPLWEIYSQLVTKEPAAVPSHIWKWADYSRPLKLAETAVTGHDADHRVLLLKNPHAQGRIATATNIIGAVQCVLPGEKTTPHRHTPAAVRLVLEGEGGATYVDGVRCDMHAGDFIVTPNWTWHGHENDSAKPVIWVDMLDVPFVKGMNNVFGQMGPANDYPETMGTLPDALFAKGGLVPVTDRPRVPYTPRFRYPWADTQAVLAAMAADADGSRTLRYSNPLDGGPVTATIDVTVTELAQDRPTTGLRCSAAAFCVVMAGEGESRIGGVTHKWGARDIFTLPEWQRVEHRATTAGARLLTVSDRPVREKLGLLREARG